MARVRIKWEQPKIERQVFNLIRRNARAAGRHVRDEMRKQVSVSAGRGAGSSRPGQPPRRRSGKLRREIKHAIRARQNRKDVKVKVGATRFAFYAAFLEFGRKAHGGRRGRRSSFMAPRPFANTTIVKRAMETAQRIMLGKR